MSKYMNIDQNKVNKWINRGEQDNKPMSAEEILKKLDALENEMSDIQKQSKAKKEVLSDKVEVIKEEAPQVSDKKEVQAADVLDRIASAMDIVAKN